MPTFFIETLQMIEIYVLLIRRLRLVDDSPGRDGGFDLVQVLDIGHGVVVVVVALQKTLRGLK